MPEPQHQISRQASHHVQRKLQSFRLFGDEPQYLAVTRCERLLKSITKIEDHAMIVTEEIEYNVLHVAEGIPVPALDGLHWVWIGELPHPSSGSQTWRAAFSLQQVGRVRFC